MIVFLKLMSAIRHMDWIGFRKLDPRPTVTAVMQCVVVEKATYD